jgi:hypothetical protein
MDLSKFGIPKEFNLRGTIRGSRLDGERLLFLFGERHSIKPGVRRHLLNAVDLHRLGAISFVGVEGCIDTAGDSPYLSHEEKKRCQELQTRHGEDVQSIIDGVLDSYSRSDFFFAKTLALVLPDLTIKSAEDLHLFHTAGERGAGEYYGRRRSQIIEFLHNETLLEYQPGSTERLNYAEGKADIQAEQEYAEDPINLQRDEVMIEKTLRFWNQFGKNKAAILNAGVSHQYRIAQRLPSEVSYLLIEQP